MSTDEIKYPDIEIQLIGNSSNAGAIMGAVSDALREAGVSPSEIGEFRMQAMSGSYDDLLRTVMRWVVVS